MPGAAAEKAVAGRWQSRWVMVLQAGCLQAGKGHLGHSALQVLWNREDEVPESD